ncbi:MAG: hypothetical protein GY710_14160 [Desulfobacteraceae bacterium]|nr:hypothetical protein [Desulfobacteraceae bacterium]
MPRRKNAFALQGEFRRTEVLTIFCHGTCFSRLQHDLVQESCHRTKAQMHPYCETSEKDRRSGRSSKIDKAIRLLVQDQDQVKLIVDGPGSFGSMTTSPSKSMMSYNTITDYNNSASKNATKQIFGIASGSGWDKNVDLICRVIMQVQPKKINMVGWSRGAVTAVKTANRLWDKYLGIEKLEINLFLIDPVPGPGNHNDNTRRLPPNVKDVKVLLEMSEGYGWGFSFAALRPMSRKTKMETIFLHGLHHSAACGELTVKEGTKLKGKLSKKNTTILQIGIIENKIAKFLLAGFLTKHSTRFDYKDWKITLTELYTLYNELQMTYLREHNELDQSFRKTTRNKWFWPYQYGGIKGISHYTAMTHFVNYQHYELMDAFDPEELERIKALDQKAGLPFLRGEKGNLCPPDPGIYKNIPHIYNAIEKSRFKIF